MTDISERDAHVAPSPLAGLQPTRVREAAATTGRHIAPHEHGRFVKGLFTTVPIVLVGSMAMAGLSFAGQVDQANAKRAPKPKAETADLTAAVRAALSAANATATVSTKTSDVALRSDSELTTASAPSTYRVQGGDTVSGVASHYGLSTASVLALNGLSWKSVIFPGQVLKLTKGATTTRHVVQPQSSPKSLRYTIRTGDTISSIARRFGVSTHSVLVANGLSWSSIIYPRQSIAIPRTNAPAPATPPVKTPPVTPPPVTPPPAPPATPATTPPAPPSTKSPTGLYVIRSGDTLTSIAKKFAVTVQSLLAANNLSITNVIYAGHSLKIPGLTTASTGPTFTPMSPEMRTNATTIVRVGQQLGVPDYGIIIALAAAMQESGVRNVNYGDLDSVGLFQQRPSAGWGARSQLLDTTYASKLFFGGPANPNKGKTRGLLDIAGWQSMTVTQAAQRVQISAYPNAYAKWETSAREWFSELK